MSLNPEISFATEQEVADIQLGRRLRHFNYKTTGEYPEGISIWLNAKDASGTLLGGFRGDVFFEWLFVNVLFVEESARSQGVGQRLLARGEQEARDKGARHVRLETFEWQAPRFYLKHGYREMCRVPDYFRGHTLFLMSKDL